MFGTKLAKVIWLTKKGELVRMNVEDAMAQTSLDDEFQE